MTQVAVIAHREKTVGGGLGELRDMLVRGGVVDPPWEEVDKSRKMPKRVEKLLDRGVDLLFVWGGDGSVQRVIDTVAGRPVTLAIVPAGTANLLATNLGIPQTSSRPCGSGSTGRTGSSTSAR